MPHETRNERDRLLVIIQEFKGDIVLVLELDTSDSHGSLAPSVALEHLLLVRTNVLQGVKCLHNRWGMHAATTSCRSQRAVTWKPSTQPSERTVSLISSALWPGRVIPLPRVWRLSALSWDPYQRMPRMWGKSGRCWCIRRDGYASRPMTIQRPSSMPLNA